MKILSDLLNLVVGKGAEHIGKMIAVPAALSVFEWVANLIHAVSDGVVTEEEMTTIVSFSSPAQIVLLGLVLLVLKMKKE